MTYDTRRGEPRGRMTAAPALANAQGDCIDCRRCVTVCPTGIDIRNGIQLECVACTACIDACDDVMTRIDRPRGLLRMLVCRKCGFVQWFASRPEKIPVGEAYETKVIKP